jgi:hypothetical protein
MLSMLYIPRSSILNTSKRYLHLLPSLFLGALKEYHGLDKQQHVETWPR